jgi:hypothetical protein
MAFVFVQHLPPDRESLLVETGLDLDRALLRPLTSIGLLGDAKQKKTEFRELQGALRPLRHRAILSAQLWRRAGVIHPDQGQTHCLKRHVRAVDVN